MKEKKKPKVIYKQSKNLSEAEIQQRVNRAFDTLFKIVDNKKMSLITYRDKSGKRILKKDFIENQKNSLFDGDAISVSEIKKSNLFSNKKDIDHILKNGLVKIRKYKNKNYVSKEELLGVIKTL